MKKRFTTEGWAGILRAQADKMSEIHRVMKENKKKAPPKPEPRVLTEDLFERMVQAERRDAFDRAIREAQRRHNEMMQRWVMPQQHQGFTVGSWDATIVTSPPAIEPQEMQEFDQPQSDFT